MTRRQNIALAINAFLWILILPASSLSQKPEYRNQIIALKAVLTLVSTISGGILLHRHRPSRLDDEFATVSQMKEQFEQSVVESNAQTQATIQHVVDTSNQRIADVTAEYNRQLELREQETARWQQMYIEANRPKFPKQYSEAAMMCQNCQVSLHQEGIIFDCVTPPPSTVPDRKLPYGVMHHWTLEPRTQKHLLDFLKLSKSGLLTPMLESALGNIGQVNWTQHQGAISFSYVPGTGTSEDEKEAIFQKAIKLEKSFPTIADTVKIGLGYLVSGESGSGKTSTGLVIAQELIHVYAHETNNPETIEAMLLDVHANKNPVWRELGINRIYSSPADILAAFEWIHDEYQSRKAGGRCNRLIIFIDEISEMFVELQAYLIATGASAGEASRQLTLISKQLISLGTGGRKYAITPIIFNQSPNCRELQMDAKQRDNFVAVYLNSVADKFAHSPACTNPACSKWLSTRTNQYRAILSGAANDSPILHPTHHDYPQIQNEQPPLTSILVRFDDEGNSEEVSKSNLDVVIPDFAPRLPVFEGVESEEQLFSQDDLEKIEQIHDLWATGETGIFSIICTVWEPVKKGSRKYREYREEYRRLTGK